MCVVPKPFDRVFEVTTHRRDVLKGIGATSIATVGGAGTVAADRFGVGGLDDHFARVRVAHASPDAPNVDVFVDDTKVLADVPFRSISDYLTVPAGSYRVTITAAGDPGTVAFEGEVSVEGGTDYTIAAIGELTEGTFRPKILEDLEKSRVADENHAAVRLVHASPDAGPVDATVPVRIFFGGIADITRSLSFGDASGYLKVPSGDRTITLETEGGNQVTVESTLQGETVYTIFVEGYLTPDDEPANEELSIVPSVEPPRGELSSDLPGPSDADARVRVAHLSPDAPDVDVRVDGNTVLSGVPFRAVSDYLSLPAGSYEVVITAAADPDTVAFEGELSVEAGVDYTVAAVGELSEGTFRPKVLRDPDSVDAGRAKLRVVHASPDAPAVDVTVNEASTTLVNGAAFGDATGFLSARPGRYELEVRPNSEGNDNPFDAEFEVALEPGTAYTAFAAGYFTVDDEPADEQFGLVVADGEPRH